MIGEIFDNLINKRKEVSYCDLKDAWKGKKKNWGGYRIIALLLGQKYMNFNQDLIEEMKKWHRDCAGEEIDDQEANEAWKNLCAYFEFLMEIDERQKREN